MYNNTTIAIDENSYDWVKNITIFFCAVMMAISAALMGFRLRCTSSRNCMVKFCPFFAFIIGVSCVFDFMLFFISDGFKEYEKIQNGVMTEYSYDMKVKLTVPLVIYGIITIVQIIDLIVLLKCVKKIKQVLTKKANLKKIYPVYHIDVSVLDEEV